MRKTSDVNTLRDYLFLFVYLFAIFAALANEQRIWEMPCAQRG